MYLEYSIAYSVGVCCYLPFNGMRRCTCLVYTENNLCIHTIVYFTV